MLINNVNGVKSWRNFCEEKTIEKSVKKAGEFPILVLRVVPFIWHPSFLCRPLSAAFSCLLMAIADLFTNECP